MGSTVFIPLVLVLFIKGAQSASFEFQNQCAQTIWVGTLSGAGSPPLRLTGFELKRGGSTYLDAPATWSGRFWGRTGCTTDPTTGAFRCATGDCGSGRIECNGAGGAPPATLVEFTLGKTDFYDTSLVDGYNVPVMVSGRGGHCRATGCARDVNEVCPRELSVVGGGGEVIACMSACVAFGDPKYCCTGDYGGPGTCKPTNYSRVFKNACPLAYSYAYDDSSSTFTCAGGGDYLVVFCPAP